MPNSKITKESERTSLKSDRRTFGKAVLAGALGGPAALSSIAEAVEEQLPSDKKTRDSQPRAVKSVCCLPAAIDSSLSISWQHYPFPPATKKMLFAGRVQEFWH